MLVALEIRRRFVGSVCRQHTAGQDQHQRADVPRGERLAQHEHACEERDRRVHVGEDERASGTDLADEREEHNEGERGADDR